MKKLLSLIPAVTMLMTLAACGGKDNTETTKDPTMNAAPASCTDENLDAVFPWLDGFMKG